MKTPKAMKVYVVTAPTHLRGIYADWPACQTAVQGVRGAKYQAVSSPEEAAAMLSNGGVRLEPGQYAFLDGNHLGGVGIVLVTETPEKDRLIEEISMTVYGVFARGIGLPALDDAPAVTRALASLRNILAELAALYHALILTPEGTTLTLVYDYLGTGAWLQGEWAIRDSLVKTIIYACRSLQNTKRLSLRYRHQPAHRSSYAGVHDYAAFNALADALATRATSQPPSKA